MKRFKFGLLPRILVAIVLGIVVGNWLPLPLTRVFITFNSIFGQFLGFMIPLSSSDWSPPPSAISVAEPDGCWSSPCS